MITATLLALLLPALVSAHGLVYSITVDGKAYPGNPVGTSPTIQSIIRQIDSNGPVKGASNPDLGCGPGAQPAALTADVNPGSNLQILWAAGVGQSFEPWIHNVGPIMYYMASCGNSCTNFNSASAKWFKVAQKGQESDGSTWYMSEIKAGNPDNLTIPSNLAPGPYLLRSELIALQGAMSPGGAEFYPSCSQLTVGGSQTGQPSPSDEVSLPGAYHDSDPGIQVNVYTSDLKYTFPGPPIASFISGGNGTAGGSGNGTTSGSGSPSPSSPTGTSASSTPSTPANAGGYPPSSSGNSSSPVPSSTGGSGSVTCKTKKRSVPEPHVVVTDKRMHRRRYRTAH